MKQKMGKIITLIITQCYCQKWPLLSHSAGLIAPPTNQNLIIRFFPFHIFLKFSYLSLCNARLPPFPQSKMPSFWSSVLFSRAVPSVRNIGHGRETYPSFGEKKTIFSIFPGESQVDLYWNTKWGQLYLILELATIFSYQFFVALLPK